MAGRRGLKCYPKHLRKNKGKGVRECEATGFLRSATHPFVEDVRQGETAAEFADITPGFGTRHPQDVVQLGVMSDPSPIQNSRPKDNRNLSKQDLVISDQEIKLSIQENRQPRIGF